MATEDDKIDTGALGTVVAVGAVAMVGISLAVNALVRHEVSAVGVGRDEVGANAYRALKREQLDKLSASATWADQQKGHVAIPIERAMNLTLADLKRSPWNATPVPPPDAGSDAAAETADAGAADAATTAEVDAGEAGGPPDSGAAAAPEPPGSAPLSPGAAPAGSAPPAPKPSAPRTLPPPTVPATPPPPASAPAQPAPPAPPATKP